MVGKAVRAGRSAVFGPPPTHNSSAKGWTNGRLALETPFLPERLGLRASLAARSESGHGAALRRATGHSRQIGP